MNNPHFDTEYLRVAILQCLRNNGTRFGLPVPAIYAWTTSTRGIRNTGDQIADALDYLETRKEPLVETVAKVVSVENQAWRITPFGRAYLDERNL